MLQIISLIYQSTRHSSAIGFVTMGFQIQVVQALKKGLMLIQTIYKHSVCLFQNTLIKVYSNNIISFRLFPF